jgi:solute carrier family 25 phosphate transporter 3
MEGTDTTYKYSKAAYATLACLENTERYKTGIYLASSASDEFHAAIALRPFEAVKVRSQTNIPPSSTGTLQGISSVVAKEAVAGLYERMVHQGGRHIPCKYRRVGGE